MTTPQQVFQAMQSARAAMHAAITPTYVRAVQAAGLDGPLVGLGHAFNHRAEPVPITVAGSTEHMPAYSPRVFEDIFRQHVETGRLEAVPGTAGGYRLTPATEAAFKAIDSATEAVLRRYTTLPQADLDWLEALLKRLEDAARRAPEPAKKFCMNDFSQPEPDASRISRIGYPLARLSEGYITDVEKAAWHRYGISGQAWDAFGLVAAGEANTATAIAAARHQTGCTADQYAAALVELAGRGWLEPSGGGAFRMTPDGEAVRAEAASTSERLRYAPFSALSSGELTALHDLLARLAAALRAIARAEHITHAVPDLWPRFTQAANALGPLYAPRMQPLCAHLGLVGKDTFILKQALHAHPAPITPALVRFPYTALNKRRENLEDVAARGFLAPLGNGAFRLTEQGRDAVTSYYITAQDYIAQGEPLLVEALAEAGLDDAELGEAELGDEALTWLKDALCCVTEAIFAGPERPNDLRHIGTIRAIAPESGDSAADSRLVWIDQYLTELILFRDDAHEAAWHGAGVPGNVWEAFSFIWRGERTTLAALAAYFTTDRRGFSQEAVAAALDDLQARGWIMVDAVATETGGQTTFAVTERGDRLRQQAEATTNRLYWGPWTVLDDDALTRLDALLAALIDAMAALEAQDRLAALLAQPV